jgi:hypothetical protein
MGRVLKLYWLCFRGAWRGSFTLANAWQGVWGILLLWAFGYWREFPVTIPDKVDEYALVFLFASLGATWLGVFLFQFSIAPAKLYWDEHIRAKSLSEELKIAQKQPNADDSKWTMSELFQHIDPDFLESDRYAKIADELRDVLSEGRLTLWGRLKETDSGSWVGPRAALTPIEKTYWYNAYFTYFFFHERTYDDVHCWGQKVRKARIYRLTGQPQ